MNVYVLHFCMTCTYVLHIFCMSCMSSCISSYIIVIPHVYVLHYYMSCMYVLHIFCMSCMSSYIIAHNCHSMMSSCIFVILDVVVPHVISHSTYIAHTSHMCRAYAICMSRICLTFLCGMMRPNMRDNKIYVSHFLPN